jgi:ubiquinone/menaquinone biosynthesis C-methylase UbiE
MEPSEVARYWEANAWTRQVRAGYDIYRDALNTPSFLAILPPIAGLDGLDIGCGEGTNTRQLARRGARMHGVDIAPTFVHHARGAEAAEPLGISFSLGDALALPFEEDRFDFVTAFMSLMDMPNQGRAFAEARRVLRPGGFLQFTILHPCFSPPHRKVLRDAERRTRAIEVGRYFDRVDGLVERWQFGTLPAEEQAQYAPFETPRFHRTLSVWVEMIVKAGFVIERFHEPRASEALAAAEPVVEDTRVAPQALIVQVRKPGAPIPTP